MVFGMDDMFLPWIHAEACIHVYNAELIGTSNDCQNLFKGAMARL